MPDRPLVRRRTVVTGLAATFLAAGCDNGDEIAPPESSGSPSAGSESPAEPESQDEALVEDVVGALFGAIDVLVAARRVAPELRPSMTPILRAHRQHVEVLEGEGAASAPSPGPGDAASALRDVRRSERRLHVTLVDAAGRAESGALARLLASMSASVTQHLSLLPSEVAS